VIGIAFSVNGFIFPIWICEVSSSFFFLFFLFFLFLFLFFSYSSFSSSSFFFFCVPSIKPQTTISMVVIKRAVFFRSCFELHSFLSMGTPRGQKRSLACL
jgi:glycerol-3-phosphate acyltransferase PlsY